MIPWAGWIAGIIGVSIIGISAYDVFFGKRAREWAAMYDKEGDS